VSSKRRSRRPSWSPRCRSLGWYRQMGKEWTRLIYIPMQFFP
jgi:hypothetical protein